jgi:RNA polymerase sigma-B factor
MKGLYQPIGVRNRTALVSALTFDVSSLGRSNRCAAMSTPPVSDRWLLERYRRDGDLAARERLVASLMPLVHSVVARYNHPRHEEDLLQAAAFGLTKAIDRFDPSRGVELRSYAIPTMHGEVRRWLRDNAWSVHVPRPLQERVLEVTRAVERLTTRDGRTPSAQQIADELGIAIEDVLEGLQAGRAYGATSLDAPRETEAGSSTLADVVGGDDIRLERAEHIAMLSRSRGVLTDAELEVLRLRFVEDLTQTEIARIVGCSQMQISRILRRCLDQLAGAVDRPPRHVVRDPVVVG